MGTDDELDGLPETGSYSVVLAKSRYRQQLCELTLPENADPSTARLCRFAQDDTLVGDREFWLCEHRKMQVLRLRSLRSLRSG